MNIKKNLTFIAEIGLNHNGNFGLIYELIKQSAQSGADIVKFQLGWRSKPNEINALTENEIDHILTCCDRFYVEPMFSIFNNEAFTMIQKYKMNYYKIASRTVNDDRELVKKVLDLKKTTFISLGMWDKEHQPFGTESNIKYLWCKSKYPTYPWDLKNFPKNFTNDKFYGYSDHSIGIDIAILAITRGAKVIEKHFTLDKSDVTIRDHALSATPDEFDKLVKIGQEIRKNLDIGI
ncbi:N-acetylneuraminate synthase family protein [Alphaproteobacteria bacterium]|jgi:N,N'-diacetyllegionaminate synthase|nr:N-acetylneuraminate synthase family protein [Alphaproteobacteria bacterium]